MNKKTISTGIIGVAFAVAAIFGLIGWKKAQDKISELEKQALELQRQEKRSAVLRSVSSQMEEIAYQQKKISDEQRFEAIAQTEYANQMRERSEVERQNAIMARESAMASERKALDAFDQAEYQRKVAEQQRIQAEYAKRVTDTLSYLALARSLGSISTTQHHTGNNEIADLLSYASYLFTTRYKGDIYTPSVYQALTLASMSNYVWPVHNGDVTHIFFDTGSGNIFSSSKYGEIIQLAQIDKQIKTKTIVKDPLLDFRGLYVNKASNNIYAVSRNGLLFIKTKNREWLTPLPNMIHPMALEPFDKGNTLLIVAENSIAELDMNTNTLISTHPLNFKVTLCSRFDHKPILFDSQGQTHLVKSLKELITKKVSVKGEVTAFASSNSTGYEAYGMKDGTIYLKDKNGKIRQLIGHRSRISRLKVNGNRIYSSSYDGTINLWIANNEKIEPMTLLSTNQWITYFTFDESKDYLWFGDHKGNISETLISVPRMVDIVKKKLKRNLTQSEWNYYIGKNVPYESFVSTNRKEAIP